MWSINDNGKEKVIRRLHLAMERHDFKCRVCNIRWSMFVRTNSLCTNPSVGDGVHNFDFRKPIKIDPQENPADILEVQEGQK